MAMPLTITLATFWRPLARSVLFTALLLLMISSSPSWAANSWRRVSEAHGVQLESRALPGERFDEFRASTTLQIRPEIIAAYLFGKYLDLPNRRIQRTFIERGNDVTVWSDVVRLPMISERCYSMRFERQALPATGVRVRFHTLNDHGTSPTPGCVALRSKGEWTLTPVPGGTQITYVSLTDLGGRVPAGLARNSLAEAAIMSVRKVAAGASNRPLPKGAHE